MKVTIEGTPKEIAALVLELQERQAVENETGSKESPYVSVEDVLLLCNSQTQEVEHG